MTKAALFKIEVGPFEPSRWGIHGYEHLYVEAQHGGQARPYGWEVVDSRFTPGMDRWRRAHVIFRRGLDEVREWVQAGGPALWDPEKRKTDRDWEPIPEGLERIEAVEADALDPSPVKLDRKKVRGIAGHAVALAIGARRATDSIIPESISQDLSPEEIAQVEREIDKIRDRLLGGVSHGPKGRQARSEVQGRAHPGVGPERGLAGDDRGAVRRGGRGTDRQGDAGSGVSAHRKFRPEDVTGKKYALAVGPMYVGGEKRFVGFEEMARGYRVDPAECLEVPVEMQGDRLPPDIEKLTWLVPQPSQADYDEVRQGLGLK